MLDCAGEGWGECVGMGSASWVDDMDMSVGLG